MQNFLCLFDSLLESFINLLIPGRVLEGPMRSTQCGPLGIPVALLPQSLHTFLNECVVRIRPS